MKFYFKQKVLRVIAKNYQSSEKLSWQKLALLLSEGVIAVMPTDTIYGVCGSALNKKTVEGIYKLRKRNPKKPFIILIGFFDDLKKFDVKISSQQRKILEKFWPGKVSVILECGNNKFKYLHRGTNTLAFRLPACRQAGRKKRELLKILEISGPLVAPSANWEGRSPAKTISEARKYFGDKVIYYDVGKISGRPSKLIKLLKNGEIDIIRI